MRVQVLCPLAVALSLCAPLLGEIRFEDVLTPSEARRYRTKTAYRARMALIRKVLERQGAKVRREVKRSRYSGAVETLSSIRVVSNHGMQLTEAQATARDFRSKKVRKLEIRLRKMGEMLDDLKTTPPFEYRSSFDDTVATLLRFRDLLLEGFFDETRPEKVRAAHPGQSGLRDRWLATSVNTQRGLRSTVSGDQFTAEEEDDIREAQEVRLRVKVLLAIAEARLDEINRRLAEQEWTRDKPNPLEFFTAAQMVRAYHRAIEVAMINIDEKVKYRTASEKEIRRSLKAVNEKMETFIPQLEPLRKLAIEKQDEDLFVEVRRAKRVSEQALTGAQRGLEALSN